MRSSQDPQGLGQMASSLRRHRRRGNLPLLILLLVLAGGGAGLWLWLRSDDEQPPATPDAAAIDPSVPEPVGEEPLDLPPLEESDPITRMALRQLSSHPRWAAWLVTDDLVRTFVQAVVDLAGGGSPTSALEFWTPADSFAVVQTDDGLAMDPVSYRRYDLAVEVFTSVETEATAELYRQLHPLFLEAYAELDVADPTFDEMIESAVGNLLRVEVPEGAVAVEPFEAVYEFAEPRYEALSPAEKQIFRMGPANARRLQQKLRAVAVAIGIPVPN